MTYAPWGPGFSSQARWIARYHLVQLKIKKRLPYAMRIGVPSRSDAELLAWLEGVSMPAYFVQEVLEAHNQGVLQIAPSTLKLISESTKTFSPNSLWVFSSEDELPFSGDLTALESFNFSDVISQWLEEARDIVLTNSPSELTKTVPISRSLLSQYKCGKAAITMTNATLLVGRGGMYPTLHVGPEFLCPIQARDETADMFYFEYNVDL